MSRARSERDAGREAAMGRARESGRRGGGPEAGALVAVFAGEESEDRVRLRWAIGGALALHLALLAAQAPRAARAVAPAAPQRAPLVLPIPRFAPPKDVAQVPPAPRARRVPFPDPTPDDPEPIRELAAREMPLDLPFDEAALAIPEAPPVASPPELYPVGGKVLPPRRLHAPAPVYPELARQVRRQGIVVVRATIDRAGEVVDVAVEKGLGFGLDESALEAVRRWRFAPATLDGRPVPVYFHLTVRFELR
jgi:protein TonB